MHYFFSIRRFHRRKCGQILQMEGQKVDAPPLSLSISVHIDSWRVAKMLFTLADKMRELPVVTTRDDKINILARRKAERNAPRET
jgi:hypothetical protein